MVGVIQVVYRCEVRLRPAEQRLDCTPHDLHVLLRHRLLLEPRGFEGVGSVGEIFDSHDEAVAESEYLEYPSADLDAARPSVAAEPDQRDYRVAVLSDCLDLADEVICPRVIPLIAECPDRVATPQPGGRECRDGAMYDVWSEKAQIGVGVASFARRVETPDELHPVWARGLLGHSDAKYPPRVMTAALRSRASVRRG